MTTKAKPTDDNLRMMEPETIMFNERNPRTTLGDISELKASIEANGIIQPIAVRAFGTGYKVVAGSHRLAAAIELGMSWIPTRIVVADDRKALELAITENVIRKDMSALDEIRAVGELAANGEPHAEIAARFGRTPRWVATRAKISRMPERVLELIGEGSLKVSEAEELAKLHVSHVEELAERAASGNMGLRWVREQVYEALRAIAGVPWTVGECSRCILRSDKQAHLFEGDGKDAPARCMDSDCWADKRAAWIAKTEKELRAKGHMPKHAFQSAYHFEHYFGSILNPADDSEMEQIGELQVAGVKERYFVNKDDGEILLRWDWSDMPEKTVKTASGDEVEEAEEEEDDGEKLDTPFEATWTRRRRMAGEFAAIVAAMDGDKIDTGMLLDYAAEAYRMQSNAPLMDKRIEADGVKSVIGMDRRVLKVLLLSDIVREFFADAQCGDDAEAVGYWEDFKDAFGINESEEVEACK